MPVVHTLGYTSDEREYIVLADRILDGTGFVDSNGTRSVRAPLYPFLLAGIFMFGHGGLFLAHIIGSLLGTLAVFLVFRLSMLLMEDRRVALAGAAIAAVYPGLVIYSTLLQTESLYIVLLLWTLIGVIRLLKSPRHSRAAGVGVLGGLAALARAAFVPFFPVLLLTLWVGSRAEWRTRARTLAVTGVVFVLTLLPWGVRNYTIHGRIIPVSTFGGPSLLLGNNPFSTGTTRLDSGYDAWVDSGLVRLTGIPRSGLSEAEWSEASGRLAREYIAAHPARWASLLVRKLYVMTVYPITNTDSYLPFQAAAVLADFIILVTAAVAALGLPTQRKTVISLLATVTFFITMHVLLHAEARYRLPVMPLMTVLSGAGIVLAAAPGKFRQQFQGSRRAVLAVVVGFIVLLYSWTAWQYLGGSL